MDLLKKYIVSGTNGAFFGNFIKTFYFGLIYGAGGHTGEAVDFSRTQWDIVVEVVGLVDYL